MMLLNPLRFRDKNPDYQIVTESSSLRELFFSKLAKESKRPVISSLQRYLGARLVPSYF